MNILALNPGSTSLKTALFAVSNGTLTERFRVEDSHSFRDHLRRYIEKKYIRDIGDIHAFGVRVVHGGAFFSQSVRVTPSVLKKISQLAELAPLHNPPAITLIHTLRSISSAPIWVSFDTAFHRTIPPHISRYPFLPHNAHHLQKYGFHGLAIQSVLRKITSKTSLPRNVIVCHLGGGCSVSAVQNGKSLDTSMGFTPQEGTMMVERSGTVDAGAFVYLKRILRMNDEQALSFLNHQSGLRGYAETHDVKRIFDEAQADTNRQSARAVSLFTHRVCQYIWQYHGLLGGADMLVFSGGIGRKNAYARKRICEQCSVLGIALDAKKNADVSDATLANQPFASISSASSRIPVLVCKADEAREIAREVWKGEKD